MQQITSLFGSFSPMENSNDFRPISPKLAALAYDEFPNTPPYRYTELM